MAKSDTLKAAQHDYLETGNGISGKQSSSIRFGHLRDDYNFDNLIVESTIYGVAFDLFQIHSTYGIYV